MAKTILKLSLEITFDDPTEYFYQDWGATHDLADLEASVSDHFVEHFSNALRGTFVESAIIHDDASRGA